MIDVGSTTVCSARGREPLIFLATRKRSFANLQYSS
jgi:hypothetical protein